MTTIAKMVLTKTRLTMAAAALALCLVGGGVVAADAQARALDLTQQSRPSAAGPSDLELDLTCNYDWFITWEEDTTGNPVLGTFNLHCPGYTWPDG